MPERPRIAVTMGDPAGIGPEIIVKALADPRVRRAARMVVVGYPGPFLRELALSDAPAEIRVVTERTLAVNIPGNLIIPLFPPDAEEPPLEYGRVDAACGRAAGRCIETAAGLAMDGAVDAIVTAPINKEALNAAGYHYPGHTEFLRALTGASDIAMFLTVGTFRVVHVTTHVAIRDVPGLITRDRVVRVTELLNDALQLLGMTRPRIAVAGLNPHAGEGGLFGDEEIRVILPAVAALADRGLDVTGPYPPDTIFARAYNGQFDAVVAMYHDQGHVALKLAGFTFREGGRDVAGVNITLGLPIIRTSVDHGTAFDIAGRDEASPRSLIEAIELAAAFAKGKSEKNEPRDERG